MNMRLLGMRLPRFARNDVRFARNDLRHKRTDL